MDKIWIRDASGNLIVCSDIFVRHNGTAERVDKAWVRDSDGNAVLVYPTAEDPIPEPQFYDKWFTLCGTQDYSGSMPQWSSSDAANVPNIPIQGEGLGKSIYFFQAYGYGSNTWSPYGRFVWNSTAGSTGSNPINGLDWGYFGSIVRRIPDIESTSVIPSKYKTRLWTRPSTLEHLGGWSNLSSMVNWDRDPVEDLSGLTIKRSLNSPNVENTVSYYEYISQGNRGSEGPINTTYTPQPDCCYRTSEGIGNYDFSSWTGFSFEPSYLHFRDATSQTMTNPPYTYTEETPSIPMVSIDETGTPDDWSGKWVVIELDTVLSTSESSYCSSTADDFPCHKDEESAGSLDRKSVV